MPSINKERDLISLAVDGATLIQPEDKLALDLLADFMAVYRVELNNVLENGGTIETSGSNGFPVVKQNPAIANIAIASKQIVDLLKELGLTPKSRKAILDEIKKDDGDMSEILKLMKGGK